MFINGLFYTQVKINVVKNQRWCIVFLIIIVALCLTPGLSTWALKADSLDPDPQSEFDVVSCELYTARKLLDLMHCQAAQHAAQVQIEAM